MGTLGRFLNTKEIVLLILKQFLPTIPFSTGNTVENSSNAELLHSVPHFSVFNLLYLDAFDGPYHCVKKCPYSELFWSIFFPIRTEYGKLLRIFPYSVQMRENIDQDSSEYGHFLRSVAFNTNTEVYLGLYLAP